jgi:hypothetical protein
MEKERAIIWTQRQNLGACNGYVPRGRSHTAVLRGHDNRVWRK